MVTESRNPVVIELETTPDLRELGDYIARIRTEKDISLPELRRRGGPAMSTVSALETGAVADRPKPETLQKLAKGLDVSYTTLLVKAGYVPAPIQRPGRINRLLSLKLEERPYVGAVNCGEPLELDEPQPIEVPEDLAHLADFVVQARGQSMTSYRINPGDLLYVKRIPKPKAALGQIVIAHVKGEGATCKLIEQIGSDIMLMSLGKERPKPRKVDEDVTVLGVVKWVVPRGFDPMESGGAPF